MTPTSDPRDHRGSLRAALRDIPDFPRPGILFKDITPILSDPALFANAIDLMATPWVDADVSHVAAIESRGFLFGAPLALRLGAALVPVRKPGKLPYTRRRVDYALEYGADALEMHADACAPGARVLVVDDVLATGGTAAAAGQLVEVLGATVAGFAFLVELGFLDGRSRLGDRRIESVIHI